MTPRTAVTYSRLSENRDGTKESVARQRDKARAHAAQLGLTVTADYADDDVSAYSGKRRPGYEAMMDALRAGDAQAVVCYQTSRVWRNARERAAAYEELGKLGIRIEAYGGPSLDLSNESGRLVGALLGAFDTAESGIKSERIREVTMERASRGKAQGAVAFGWRRVNELTTHGHRLSWHDEVCPLTAPVVREITARLLAGETLGAVAADLNARRIPTGRELLSLAPGQPFLGAGKWLPTTVKQVAVRPANAGIYCFRGEPMGKAEAPALIDATDYARLTAILSDPLRRKAMTNRRQHLLSVTAWATCGVCGGELRSVSNLKDGVRRPDYACATRSCVTRRQGAVDEHLGALVVRFTADPANRARLAGGTETGLAEAVSTRDSLKAEMTQYADDLIAGLITREQLHRLNAALGDRLAEAEQLVRATARLGGAREIPQTTAAEWEAASIDTRRAILTALEARVVIETSPVRGRIRFNPDLLTVTFGGHQA